MMFPEFSFQRDKQCLLEQFEEESNSTLTK